MNPLLPNAHLLAALYAAAKLQPVGKIIRLSIGDDPNAPVGFGVRLSLDGRGNPGFSGFVASRAFDRLKSISGLASPDMANGHKECVVYVDRDDLVGRMLNQFSFTQTYSHVIVAAIGDESAAGVIETVMRAVQEWSDGKHQLFDNDGYLADEKSSIAVRVDAPRNMRPTLLRLLDTICAFIALGYAVFHLWQF